MAGCVAAMAAAEAGAEVVVLESGPALGGSARLSRGLIWAVASAEAYGAIDPGADLERLRAIGESLPKDLAWLGQYGVEVGARIPSVYEIGAGYKIATPMPEVFDALHRALEEKGVQVRTNTVIEGVFPHPAAHQHSWAVEGTGSDDGPFHLSTRALVLATGSYAADMDRWQRLLPDGARHAVPRCTPHSRGTALAIAERLNLKLAGTQERFYAHLIPFGVSISPEQFGATTLNLSQFGILLAQDGHRFTEEHRGDWFNAEAVGMSANGVAALMLDRHGLEAARNTPRYPGAAPFDPIPELRRLGATIITASDPVALFEDLLTPIGQTSAETKEAVRGSVQAFNREAEAAGRPALDEPPFMGILVVPGITFGKGGLAVDRDLQALHESGEVCKGLFVAGVDVGGLYEAAYAGGLAPALVLGRQAGRHASQFALAGRKAS